MHDKRSGRTVRRLSRCEVESDDLQKGVAHSGGDTADLTRGFGMCREGVLCKDEW